MPSQQRLKAINGFELTEVLIVSSFRIPRTANLNNKRGCREKVRLQHIDQH